jgi:mono/diheme cytochrome c family protein
VIGTRKILFLSFIVATVFACSSNNSVESDVQSDQEIGRSVFKDKCVICHGNDGRKGLGGAKLLPNSTLSVAQRVELISQGKGKMMPYAGVLTPQEIKAVAEYTTTLK